MNIIYQDKNLLVINKPAGINSDKELMMELIKELPELIKAGEYPRHGLIHRLDKDTSGILLIAKNNKSLSFFQKQFKERKVDKKYIALVQGTIPKKSGEIKTLINREGIKQKTFPLLGPQRVGSRIAETSWKIIKEYKEYTFVEATPKTGRKHQIRVHFAHLGFPIAGDKLYSFKNKKKPKGLQRQFLHANQLKIRLLDGKEKIFRSDLPEELKQIIKIL
ncbi:MAG: RluA family pseudouridine synthase [Patescibacteria group bacterium]|nr:RluA family pseudouridine synthase [Patescibacteria group bacterium]